MKSGFVAVVGRPNVGKSTLVNALVGTKVSITSSRPQTTRNTVRGIVTRVVDSEPAWQMVLIDTPGVHKPRTELGNRLNVLVTGTLAEVDAVAFLVDGTAPIGPGDRLIAERLRDAGARVVVVVTKVDAAGRPDVAAQLATAAAWDFDAYVPVSALTGDNLEPLVSELVARLPEGPLYFPADTVTDRPDAVVAADIIREKFLERLHEELPHSVAVVVDDLETAGELLVIRARVVVERPSQKGIVIGKGGAVLGAAGTEARHELESLFGTRVHLDLRVTVEPEWQRRPELLDRLGFPAT